MTLSQWQDLTGDNIKHVRYPCTDLGSLTSHVHPHFAIMDAAIKLAKYPGKYKANALKILQAHDSAVKENPFLVDRMFNCIRDLHDVWLSQRVRSRLSEYLPNGPQRRHGEGGGDRRTLPSRSSRSKTPYYERSSSGSGHSDRGSAAGEVAGGAQVELANPGLTPDSTDEDDDYLDEDVVETDQTARIESWRTEVAKSVPEA
jgi:hypothetical protein